MLQTCRNKIGLTCTYTPELAQDLLAIHHLTPEEIFSKVEGTCFSIRKFDPIKDKQGKWHLVFELTTNNEKDGSFLWVCQTEHPGYNLSSRDLKFNV